MSLLSIFDGCIQVIATSIGVVNAQVWINISSYLCEQAGIRASSTMYKRSMYTSYSLWFIIGKTTMPTTALPVAGFFIWNTDLAQDASDNSLSPALFTEVGSRLVYYKIQCFPKCHYQSHFAGGLNASMENYLATWWGEKWEEKSKLSSQWKWSSTRERCLKLTGELKATWWTMMEKYLYA